MRPWPRWRCALLLVALAAGLPYAQNSAIAQKQPNSFLNQPLPGRAVPQDQPSVYKPDTLYQYIDGGADIYLLYDFRSLLHQDLRAEARN